MRRVLTALQHHRDADAKPRPSLFARIVRVAEDYDTLVHRGKRVAPTYALAAMLKWSGTRYDPVLLQLLVNALGAYPPGSLLRLADGRVVRTTAPALTREAFAHPLARCVRLADGSPATLRPSPGRSARGRGARDPAARRLNPAARRRPGGGVCEVSARVHPPDREVERPERGSTTRGRARAATRRAGSPARTPGSAPRPRSRAASRRTNARSGRRAAKKSQGQARLSASCSRKRSGPRREWPRRQASQPAPAIRA